MGQKGSKETPSVRSKDSRQSSSSNLSTTAEPTRAQYPLPNHLSFTSPLDPKVAVPGPPQTNSGVSTGGDSLDKFFQKYKDDVEDAILAAGMEQFCEDLDVNPTDFIVLVLAWKFQASEMCRFTREEFINGCQRLKATDAKSLKRKFPDLVQEATQSDKSFKDLYNFTFSFGLDHSSGQRTLPIDMAIPLWELVFSHKTPPLLQKWCDFLRENETRGISRDSWNMFLPFITTIKPDFSNYDESEAWPSLFDDFVEQELEKER